MRLTRVALAIGRIAHVIDDNYYGAPPTGFFGLRNETAHADAPITSCH